MISHFEGSPQGPSLSFFFSWGPVGCSGTRCVEGAAAAAAGVSFTPLLVVVFSGVVVVLGVVLYAAAAGTAWSCLTPVDEVPSSHW